MDELLEAELALEAAIRLTTKATKERTEETAKPAGLPPDELKKLDPGDFRLLSDGAMDVLSAPNVSDPDVALADDEASRRKGALRDADRATFGKLALQEARARADRAARKAEGQFLAGIQFVPVDEVDAYSRDLAGSFENGFKAFGEAATNFGAILSGTVSDALSGFSSLVAETFTGLIFGAEDVDKAFKERLGDICWPRSGRCSCRRASRPRCLAGCPSSRACSS